jgi:hypothetical protein
MILAAGLAFHRVVAFYVTGLSWANLVLWCKGDDDD